MRYLLLFIGIMILSTSVFADGVIVLTDVNVQDPKITVNYTEDVRMLSASLTGDSSNPIGLYTLRQVPPSNPTTPQYVKQYIFYTGTESQPEYFVTGRYLLSLSAVTAEGNETFDQVDFTVKGLDIVLVTPATGVAQSSPYDVFIHTSIDGEPAGAMCDYKTTPSQSWTPISGSPTSTHIIRLSHNGFLYVRCTEPEGRITETSFSIGWDSSPPTIQAVANPSYIIDPNDKTSFVSVQTNEPTVCTLDGQYFEGESPSNPGSYSTIREKQVSYDHITTTYEQNITHLISCKNLAGLNTAFGLNVTVNFGLVGTIDVLNPPQLVNQNSFDLIVRPSFNTNGCTVNDAAMSPQNDVFVSSFQNVQEGNVTFRINCTGERNVGRTYVVTVDTTPPVMQELNASSLVCGNTVSAEFYATDENGVLYYTYTVIDDTSLLIENITVQESAEIVLLEDTSTLTWEVFATDNADNNATPMIADIPSLRYGQDEECGLPPFITLLEPPLGFATSAPYNVRISTLRPSECRYSLQSGVPWSGRVPFGTSDGLTHSKAFALPDQDIYVWCTEIADLKNHTKKFHVGYDATPPTLGVEAVPNPLIDPAFKLVIMTVTTSDPTHCTYNGESFESVESDPSSYTTQHVTTLDFSDVTSQAPMARPQTIVCKNLAGLQNTETYVVFIDLGTGIDVTLLSPGEYTSEAFITLSVGVNMDAACTWAPATDSSNMQPFDSSVDRVHTVGLGNLQEGTHQYLINCLSATEFNTSIVSFIVDRTAPVLEDLSGPDSLCQGGSGKYYFNVTGIDSNPVISYSLDGPSGASFQDNTTNAFINIDSTGLEAGTYTLSLTPINRAGVAGIPVSKTITILDSSSSSCTQPDDHCTNGVLDIGEEGIDCGGTCQNACTSCSLDTECTSPNTCESGVCVAPPPPSCGNGVIDAGESCDGSNIASLTCSVIGFTGGTLKCASDCFLDTTQCAGETAAACGDGIVEVGESCDGTTALTCSDFSLSTGTVSCVSCNLITSGCRECTGDLDCPIGKICRASSCVLPGGTTPPPGDNRTGEVTEPPLTGGNDCTSDFECPDPDDECVRGTCVPRDTRFEPTPTPPGGPGDPIEPEGFSWLGLVLLILGILLIGGGGYVLYQQSEDKKIGWKPPPTGAAPQRKTPPGRQPPVVNKKNQIADRMEAIREQHREQGAQKAQERHKLFDTFGDKSKERKKSPSKSSKSPAKKEVSGGKKKEDSAFDELEKL